MQLTWLKKRLGTAIAVIAAAAGIGVLMPAPAQADAEAVTYWTFRNLWVSSGEKCLSSGVINSGHSRVFLATCNGSNFQQWDWRGSDPGSPIPFLQLQNKATGLCLATDNLSYSDNAVWTSRCEWRDGMRFHYDGEDGSLDTFLKHPSTQLTGRDSGAVYGFAASQVSDHRDVWIGAHS